MSGKMVELARRTVRALIAVLGVLLEGVVAINLLLDVQERDVLRGFFFVFLTVLGDCLSVRFDLRAVQPAG